MTTFVQAQGVASFFVALLGALTVLACVPTDSGNPPVVDRERVTPLAAIPMPGEPPTYQFVGEAGAVDRESDVFVWMLTHPTERDDATADESGAFVATITSLEPPERIRLAAWTEADGFSMPIDFVDGGLRATPSTLPACLELPEIVELNEGRAEVSIRSTCDGEVSLTVLETFGDLVAAVPPALTDVDTMILTSSAASRMFVTARIAFAGAVTGGVLVSAFVN